MPARKFGTAEEIEFTDFAPDADPTTPGIILDSDQALPTTKGYRARNAAAQFAPALPAKPLGAYIALYASGATSIIAATSTHIYRLSGGVWVVIDTTGPFAATHQWNFTQFGDDVIAVNPDVTNMLVATGIGGTFGNLSGSPPSNAIDVIAVAGFVSAFKTNQWFNSSAGTDVGWTPNVQTQSGSGFLYDYPGNITAGAAFFRTQIIWKQFAMWQLLYQGGTIVWASSVLSTQTGTPGPGAVINLPESIAFLGTDDFYITQGYAPTRIPNNLKEWFFNTSADTTQFSAMQSWYDPTNSVAYWHYVSTNPPFAGVPDQYVAWNIKNNRWAHGYLNTTFVLNNTQPGLINGFYFDTNNVLQSWTAAPQSMMLLTGYQGIPDRISQLTSVKPKYNVALEPTSATLIPRSVYVLGDSDRIGLPAPSAVGNTYVMRQSNRYHRVQLNTVGACEIEAISVQGRESGIR